MDFFKKTVEATSTIADYTPGVGFVKGLVHEALGDRKRADRAIERQLDSLEYVTETAIRVAGETLGDEPNIHYPSSNSDD